MKNPFSLETRANGLEIKAKSPLEFINKSAGERARAVSPMKASTKSALASVQQISSDTLKARAYAELRRSLLAGEMSPGEQVVVRVIAERMGAGVMPVREGIHQLVTEGGFEVLPNRSVRVPILSKEDLREIFAIRVRLEGLAARLAAERASADEVQELSGILKSGKVFDEKAAPHDAMAQNFAFHFSIYKAARSPYLLAMIERLWLRVGPLLIAPYQASRAKRARFLSTKAMHPKLVTAIRDREEEQAESLMTEILKHSLNWHLEFAKGR